MRTIHIPQYVTAEYMDMVQKAEDTASNKLNCPCPRDMFLMVLHLRAIFYLNMQGSVVQVFRHSISYLG